MKRQPESCRSKLIFENKFVTNFIQPKIYWNKNKFCMPVHHASVHPTKVVGP